MIEVKAKECCCGCGACASACPVGCISMETDVEGFAYPSVDATRCVGCGCCERACPFLADVAPTADEPVAYAARATDDALRLASSSGGAFSELCRPALGAGGAVFGVAMDQGSRGCSFVRADSWEGLAPMRGSKYLQADPRSVYADVLAELRAGRRVLFCGTPCQANALRLFLGRDWEGLLVVDFVCHGVPSPRLWAECVADLEQQTGRRLASVGFRCKEAWWRRSGLSPDGIFEPSGESPYLRMFLADVCLRPSCYACRAKGAARLADVTIADFWGVERVAPEMSDDLGCSLVIARTGRGREAVIATAGRVELLEVPYADAAAHNAAEFRAAARPPARDRFFLDLDGRGYRWVVVRYGRPPALKRAKALAKAAILRLGSLWHPRGKRGEAPSEGSRSPMRYGIRYLLE